MTPFNLQELSAFQRQYVRAEYRFLRKMGVDRLIAKGSMYRTAIHLYLESIRFGRDLPR